MNVYAIINGINALCAFVLACVILSRGLQKPAHRSAFLWYLFLFLWTFPYFIWGIQTSMDTALKWFQALLYSCCVIHVVYFHFVLDFSNKLSQYKKYLFLAYASSVPLLVINSFNGLIDVSYVRSLWQFEFVPHASLLLPALFPSQIFFLGLSFYIMQKTINESVEPFKTRIRLFYITGIWAWIGGLTNWFILYDLLPIPPIGNIFVLLYMLTGVYLLFKHDIFGLNLVVKRTFTYAILTLCITLIFTLFIIFSERVFRAYLGYNSLLVTLLAAATITFCFNPLRGAIATFVDKRFFGKSIGALSEENFRMRYELQDKDKMRAVATLAAGMAHEIKNPLTAIQTFAEYLPSKYDDPAFRDNFQRIMLQEVKRANGIVSQVLEFAKPRQPILSRADLRALVDDTIEFMSADFIKQNVQIVKDYSDTPLAHIDAHQIRQVILNLLINSLKAMPHGGQLFLSIHPDNSAGFVNLSVKDTGKGISKEHLPHIFEPFYTANSDGGSGLGLAIVYNIIKEHGGSITVRSETGHFTEFNIRLKSV